MSKLSTKIKVTKILAIALLISTSALLYYIGDFESFSLGILIVFILLGIFGVMIEKSFAVMGAAIGIIILLILVSLIYSYSDSSIIKNNSILSELTPKEDNFGIEMWDSFQGMIYIAFSILLLCYIEVGYSVIRFSKFGKTMKLYNENGKKYGYEKTNFYTSKLKDSINQYFIFIGSFTGLILCLLVVSLNFNEVLARVITEQLSNSIEFYAIYGQVLSIFAMFAIIGISRMFIPERKKIQSKTKLEKKARLEKMKKERMEKKVKAKLEKKEKKKREKTHIKNQAKEESIKESK